MSDERSAATVGNRAKAANPLILAPDGKEFESQELAQRFFKERGLDPDTWGVEKHNGGWVIATYRWIATQRAAVADIAVAQAQAEAQGKALKFFWIECGGKTSPNDVPFVPVSINNFQLRIQRGIPVPVPENVVEVLKNASVGQWEADPAGEQPAIEAGRVDRYPFRIIKEATEQEFRKYLVDGNKLTSDEVARIRRANG